MKANACFEQPVDRQSAPNGRRPDAAGERETHHGVGREAKPAGTFAETFGWAEAGGSCMISASTPLIMSSSLTSARNAAASDGERQNNPSPASAWPPLLLPFPKIGILLSRSSDGRGGPAERISGRRPLRDYCMGTPHPGIEPPSCLSVNSHCHSKAIGRPSRSRSIVIGRLLTNPADGKDEGSWRCSRPTTSPIRPWM